MTSRKASDLERRVRELRDLIRKADDQYYNLGQSDVTDATYDEWFAELRHIEADHPQFLTPDSPTQRVGAPLPKGEKFETVEHLSQMGSLESLMEAEEVVEFVDRARRLIELDGKDSFVWFCEPKLDGASANLIYEGGRFVRGLSRGDGMRGEDLSQNLRTIRNLPLHMRGDGPHPTRIEVRGEVIMSREAFHRLQENEETSSEGTFRNARNTVAGTLKLQDPRVVKRRPLDFIAYGIGYVEGFEFATHREVRARLEEWGFTTATPTEVAEDAQAILRFHDAIEAARDELPYELDGIVAKVDDIEAQRRLGQTARTPRWALAYKFAPRVARTRLLAIGAQVGRTGAVTPVAQLEPVDLAGVTVRNASLHNWALVAERDFRAGDLVEIQRAGDVIPEVVRVFLEERPADSKATVPPTICPVCGGALHTEGKFVYCGDLDCKAQLAARIVHLASRRAMDIEGLGPKQVEQLIESGIVQSIEDVFTLSQHRDRLLELERWGERSTQKLLDNIERSKTPALARFLNGIGIRHVGEQTAKDLAANFGSLDRLREATPEQLTAVPGVGPEVQTAILDFFASPRNRKTLENLARCGVHPLESEPTASGPLAGHVFLFTGSLESMPRDEARERVEALGARSATGISKKVTDVVAGAVAGSKLEKAKKLGLRILDEQEFLALLDRE